jgi:hypothetical protein
MRHGENGGQRGDVFSSPALAVTTKNFMSKGLSNVLQNSFTHPLSDCTAASNARCSTNDLDHDNRTRTESWQCQIQTIEWHGLTDFAA